MSHELRTPLNAIIGYSELMLEEAEELQEDTFTPDLEKIQTAGRHLLTLINDILDISKIEAGKMELYVENFNISSTLDEVVNTIQPLLDKNNNELKIDLADGIGEMRADVTRIRQILFNLLSNASKFTEDGEITLTVTREMGWTTFSVSDTGIGMSDEQLSQLFEAFTQADTSTTRQYGGTGLGLTLVREFCQMMGGSISVDSEEGIGSVFTVHLPNNIEDDSTERPPSLDQSVTSHADVEAEAEADESILIIDDDPECRALVRRFLEGEGYSVITASGGVEGLELARRTRPRAILLDVMMPNVDGWSVLNTLKGDPELADIPVIMVSMIDERNLGFALGASEYLSKPIEWPQLKDTLDDLRANSSCPTALVIDDEADARELLRRGLEREGWSVREAKDGEEALELMSEASPSVILLDLMMPNMDGFELLTRLRRDNNWQSIPVIVVTAMDLDQEQQERLDDTHQTLISKTAFNQGELLSEIREQVNSIA